MARTLGATDYTEREHRFKAQIENEKALKKKALAKSGRKRSVRSDKGKSRKSKV